MKTHLYIRGQLSKEIKYLLHLPWNAQHAMSVPVNLKPVLMTDEITESRAHNTNNYLLEG